MKYVLLVIPTFLFILMITNAVYAQDLYTEISQMFENLTPNTIGEDHINSQLDDNLNMSSGTNSSAK